MTRQRVGDSGLPRHAGLVRLLTASRQVGSLPLANNVKHSSSNIKLPWTCFSLRPMYIRVYSRLAKRRRRNVRVRDVSPICNLIGLHDFRAKLHNSRIGSCPGVCEGVASRGYRMCVIAFYTRCFLVLALASICACAAGVRSV